MKVSAQPSPYICPLIYVSEGFMKIRSKISLYLGPFVLLVISSIFILNYYVIRKELENSARLELAELEKNMHRATQSLLSTAISNYLRGITEKNYDYIEEQYARFRSGRISEAEAKDNIQIHFDLQIIGESGYFVAVRETPGQLYLDLHPYLARQECADRLGCQVWARNRQGYVEYDWKNPADNSYRKKAAYIMEFPQWNWIVGASSYRDEFVDLVLIEDLKKLLGPVRINKSGYFYLFDQNLNFLIHPEINTLQNGELVNSRGESILEKLIASENGYLTYSWKSPSDKKAREKYAFVEKLEGYNWYLVASGYLDEIYEPIAYLKQLTLLMTFFGGVALFLIIFRLSNQLTTPLKQLRQGISSFYDARLPITWERQGVEEIDILGDSFSRMTRELTSNVQHLQETNSKLAASHRENEKGKALLDSILDSMPSIIIGVDPQMKITQWNNQASTMTGLAASDAVGKSLFSAYPQLLRHQQTLLDSLTQKTTTTLQHTYINAKKKQHYIEITLFPLVTGGNEGGVIRIDEITSRVEMEQRLRQSQKMDAVGQLAGGIAHDFNNMLSGIVGAAELLRLKAGPEQQKLIKIISEASARAGELISKLLAFSRKETVSHSAVNMHTIINNSVDMLKRTLDKRIDITTGLKAERHVVIGDRSQLQSSLLNIGINSGHAMPTGGQLHIATEVTTLDAMYCSTSPFELVPGTYLAISLRDSGCGIIEDHLKRIFEPFFTTREQDKGTGLGLAAVYGAVQHHHGAVTVHSELDEGTEIKIYLPVSDVSEADEPEMDQIIAGKGCILIIDDEDIIRTTARLMLEKLGYEIVEAENGKEGLAMYREYSDTIDVVLLDMLMPVMDGTECFHKLQEIDPGVSVIISSGFTRDADLHRMREDGLQGFVRKPYNLAELSMVVAQVLREGTAEPVTTLVSEAEKQ